MGTDFNHSNNGGKEIIVFNARADREDSEDALTSLQSARNMLFSYYYLDKDHEFINKIMKRLERIIIDSGAFQAWSIKKEINLDQYCEYCFELDKIKKKNNLMLRYIQLDTIGNPETTLRNLFHMRSIGLNPIPVWHVNAPASILREIIKTSSDDVVMIGGAVGKGRHKSIIKVYDIIFKMYPNQKFHALGMSSCYTGMLHPWFSLDSSAIIGTHKYRGRYETQRNGVVKTVVSNKLKESQELTGLTRETVNHIYGQSAREYVEFGERETEKWIAKGINHWKDEESIWRKQK